MSALPHMWSSNLIRLLHAPPERPSDGRAAEKRYDLASAAKENGCHKAPGFAGGFLVDDELRLSTQSESAHVSKRSGKLPT
jgi:hypothetical protein